ncbi:MAG: bifunctional precorrin-2 dehydrogenase/sirohydrochlorin ferrochelatase [Acidobacteria bacterium]|nr:bifunctional precorrin-2 dehydrogenase/sirohydrochlorin ferrochelatase [Acidobacteriota bacterium]
MFLKLTGRPVLVVGGGPVATSKLEGLLAAGAEITVVAPDVTGTIRQAGVRVLQRPFEESDLDGVWYVVAAATPEVNAAVAKAAGARQLFVNAVDDPPNATAYLGGVVRRGVAAIAISTGGRAPALAGLLRESIDALLPGDEDLEAWAREGDALKRQWRSTGVPMDARRAQMAEVIAREYCGRMPGCARPVAPAGGRDGLS